MIREVLEKRGKDTDWKREVTELKRELKKAEQEERDGVSSAVR